MIYQLLCASGFTPHVNDRSGNYANRMMGFMDFHWGFVSLNIPNAQHIIYIFARCNMELGRKSTNIIDELCNYDFGRGKLWHSLLNTIDVGIVHCEVRIVDRSRSLNYNRYRIPPVASICLVRCASLINIIR